MIDIDYFTKRSVYTYNTKLSIRMNQPYITASAHTNDLLEGCLLNMRCPIVVCCFLCQYCFCFNYWLLLCSASISSSFFVHSWIMSEYFSELRKFRTLPPHIVFIHVGDDCGLDCILVLGIWIRVDIPQFYVRFLGKKGKHHVLSRSPCAPSLVIFDTNGNSK